MNKCDNCPHEPHEGQCTGAIKEYGQAWVACGCQRQGQVQKERRKKGRNGK